MSKKFTDAKWNIFQIKPRVWLIFFSITLTLTTPEVNYHIFLFFHTDSIYIKFAFIFLSNWNEVVAKRKVALWFFFTRAFKRLVNCSLSVLQSLKAIILSVYARKLLNVFFFFNI